MPDTTDSDYDLPDGIDEGEFTDPEGLISEPFDPTLIRVERSTPTIALLTKRIEHKEINLAPDFQRKGGIWTEDAQSRLIESILIRIPLPAFYVDATNEDQWLVVDGLQRLTTLRRFVVDKSLRLSGLEFLHDLIGKKFTDLPRNLQRRIEETEVIVFQIQPGTPPEVKFNIFKRINTGGLPLSAQEIRNAINGERVRDFIKELAESSNFKNATKNSIGDKRMADRECVTRFLAFLQVDPRSYTSKDFDNFLNTTMGRLNDPDQVPENKLADLKRQFEKSMLRASLIFGKHSFRKYYGPKGRISPINKALFESISCNLAKLTDSDADTLVSQSPAILEAYSQLIADVDFNASISQGTGDPNRVRRRFAKVQEFFEAFI